MFTSQSNVQLCINRQNTHGILLQMISIGLGLFWDDFPHKQILSETWTHPPTVISDFWKKKFFAKPLILLLNRHPDKIASTALSQKELWQSSYRCFLCNVPGHRAASFPTGKPRPYYEKSPAPPGIPNPVRGNAAVTFDHQCSFYEGKAFLKCGCTLPMVGSVCIHGYGVD